MTGHMKRGGRGGEELQGVRASGKKNGIYEGEERRGEQRRVHSTGEFSFIIITRCDRAHAHSPECCAQLAAPVFPS